MNKCLKATANKDTNSGRLTEGAHAHAPLLHRSYRITLRTFALHNLHYTRHTNTQH